MMVDITEDISQEDTIRDIAEDISELLTSFISLLSEEGVFVDSTDVLASMVCHMLANTGICPHCLIKSMTLKLKGDMEDVLNDTHVDSYMDEEGKEEVRGLLNIFTASMGNHNSTYH